jgi:MFS family permease
MSGASAGVFRSLKGFNFRLWSIGAIVSNIGTWMQRMAQDWLVLTVLTHKSATAMGVVVALQFGPMLLLLPVTGYAADHFDRRKLLIATQGAMGVLALGLGLLTVAGLVQLWQVYVFAFLLGCVAAFDSPARQAFVSELVGEADLSNAVALNSTSFNAARLIGPAVAGLLITAVGCGWMFLINAASFAAVIGALVLLRVGDLHTQARAGRGVGGLLEGFGYVWGRPDLRVIMVMLGLICTFGMNFPISISTMSVTVFHGDAAQYGLLSSLLAAGAVGGALLIARRRGSNIPLMLIAAAMFGLGCALAAIMPNAWLFALALPLAGAAGQAFNTSSNSAVQLSTEPLMRGRVMAILLAVALGGAPLGSPFVGWITDHYGPRWGLAIAAASGVVAALVGVAYLVRYRGLRVRVELGRPRVVMEEGR